MYKLFQIIGKVICDSPKGYLQTLHFYQSRSDYFTILKVKINMFNNNRKLVNL